MNRITTTDTALLFRPTTTSELHSELAGSVLVAVQTFSVTNHKHFHTAAELQYLNIEYFQKKWFRSLQPPG